MSNELKKYHCGRVDDEFSGSGNEYDVSIDWEYWTHLPRLRPIEAAALLLQIDPDRVEELKNDERLESSQLFKRYRMMTRMIERSIEAQLLELHPTFRNIILWAREQGVDYPRDLNALNKKLPPMRPYKAIIRNKNKKIEELEFEIERMKLDLEEAKKHDIETESPRAYGNIYRMILSMAKEKYGYTKDINNAASKSIAAAIERAGFSTPKDQTVRNILENARQHLDY